MKIGFDAKRYFHNRTGLGNYSRDLVDGIIRLHPEHHYFLFDKRPAHLEFPSNVIAAVPYGSKFLWRERGIIKEFKRFNIDLYHGLSNELPFGKWPSHVKKIVTIHDVIFRHFPQHYGYTDRLIYHKKTEHALKIADVIVATSKATADDLVSLYGADEKKLKVIYQTCGKAFTLQQSLTDVELFKSRNKLPNEFILYVSSFQTRKHHLALLKAFQTIKGADLKLVLAGRKGETSNEVQTFIKANALEHQVMVMNDLSGAELPLLYRSAQSFVYPSMIEGFGIPLIEAAYSGLPLLVNDVAIFRELAPPGSLIHDVNDAEGFARQLVTLSKMPKIDYTQFLKAFDADLQVETMMKLYTGSL